MINLLPVFGLVAPPILYFVFFGLNSSAFSAIGLSGDNMLIGVSIITVIVWTWSGVYAKSANKFFAKMENSNFKKSFGVQSISETTMLFIFLFTDALFEVNNYIDLAQIFLIIFFVGNALRLWLTSLAFGVEIKTAANANKFNLLEETVVWGLGFLLCLMLDGVFIK